jgi:hypothetical protein
MPPELSMKYLDQYQTFHSTVANLAKDLIPMSAAELKQELQQLQATFRQTIGQIDLEAIPFPINHRLQSLQVEIGKELRLLQVDVLFLQTAKQTDSIAHRQQQIQTRLETLGRYCEIAQSLKQPLE